MAVSLPERSKRVNHGLTSFHWKTFIPQILHMARPCKQIYLMGDYVFVFYRYRTVFQQITVEIFTARKRSLGQGNIFIGVCQEFCSRGGWYPSMHCRWYPSMPCSRPSGGSAPEGGCGLLLWPSVVVFCYALLLWPSGLVAF